MSTARERPSTVVRLVGPPGLARDIAALVLDVEAGEGSAAPVAPHEYTAVVVLVDPAPADWDTAVATGAPVVLVTGSPLDPAGAAEVVLRGADAVVHAGSNPEKLLDAVRVLAGGGTLLDPEQARALARAARTMTTAGAGTVRLSGREHQILASIARGEAVKQTAIALGITAKTVENLQGRLFCKLGVRNRVEAVARAFELDLLAGPAGGTGEAGRAGRSGLAGLAGRAGR